MSEVLKNESNQIDDNKENTEYYDNGKVKTVITSSGMKEEYDENENLTHFKDSNGYEEWSEYDENGRVICFRNSERLEEYRKYDEKGNLTYTKGFNGSIDFEEWREYNENGDLTHVKESYGNEEWYEYHENGNLKSYKDFYGEIREYNEKGQITYSKDCEDTKTWYEYYENGNIENVSIVHSDGSQELSEYYKNGVLKFYRDNEKEELYDNDGTFLYSKDYEPHEPNKVENNNEFSLD